MTATKQRLILLISSFLLLAGAGQALAAQGGAASITLEDLDHNGKTERAVLSINNPEGRTWHINGTSGLTAWYGDKQLNLKQVFVAGSALTNPVKIEMVWDEADVPVDTSAAQFEIAYAPQQVGAGIDDGFASLGQILKGDFENGTTELDAAAPILVSTNPLPGTLGGARDQTIVLTFSEPMDASTFSYTSNPDSGGWSAPVWNTEGTQVSLDHVKYTAGATVTFDVAGKDTAGNALVPGALTLEPFHFTVTSSITNVSYDHVFAINEPRAGATLTGGAPAVIAWYSNRSDVTQVRFSYVNGAGSSSVIATVPVSTHSFLWHPSNELSSGQLKAELLNSLGSVIDLVTVNPINVTRSLVRGSIAIAPAVSALTDTTAILTVGTDAPMKTASLECDSLPRTEVISSSGDRPSMLTVQLTGLVAGHSYKCDFLMKDLAGENLIANVAPFTPGTSADTTPPQLVAAPGYDQFDWTAKTLRVTWTTDEPSTASIDYGVYKNYGGHVADANLSTTHALTLTGLTPGALHQLRVTSTDAKGNTGVSVDYGFVFLHDGDRIKTSSSSAVYWYKGGKRYVFPNSDSYFSWFKDFTGIVTVQGGQLSSIPLGGNVKMQAGVYLIKIQSDPKTYAVEPDGTLRWIQTETQAKVLYGDAWAKRVRDVDVSLFVDYKIGDPLAEGETPAGYNH